MRIAVRHVEVFDNLAFIPDVIAGSHHVDAQIEKLFGKCRSNAKPSRGILAVGDDQIDRMLLAQFREPIFYDGAPGPSKNVTDKKNSQKSDLSSQASGTMSKDPEPKV